MCSSDLVQTHWVRDELQNQFPELAFEVSTMDTQGDKVLDVSLSKIGDKGLFTQEIGRASCRERV